MNGQGPSLGEKIEWLADDVYPGRDARERPQQAMMGYPAAAFKEGLEEKRASLRETLSNLPDRFVEHLYDARQEDSARKAIRQLAELTFSGAEQPVWCSTQLWGRHSEWTIEEAAALVWGLNPAVVNRASIDGVPTWNSIRSYYDDRFSQFTRAQAQGELGSGANPRPVAVIEWCQAKQLPFYEPLVLAVAMYGESPADWRARFEASTRAAVLQEVHANLLLTEQQDTIHRLQAEAVPVAETTPSDAPARPYHVAKLEADLKAANAQITQLTLERDEAFKRKTSFRKALLGIARGTFRYGDQNAPASPINKMRNAIEKGGLTIDDQTLRRLLNEAESDPSVQREEERAANKLDAKAAE